MSETEANEPLEPAAPQETTAAPQEPTAAHEPIAAAETPPGAEHDAGPVAEPNAAVASQTGPSRRTQVVALVVTAGVGVAVGLTAGVIGARLVGDDGPHGRDSITAAQDGRDGADQPPQRPDGDRGAPPPNWSAGGHDDDQDNSGDSGGSSDSDSSGAHGQSGAS